MDAPGGPADFEESDELQRLRRRAYGPNADIAGDAAAQARLSELEGAERRERAPGVDAAAALPAPVTESDSTPIDGARSAPWWRRRRSLPWVIAAVAVLAAAIVIGVFVVDESSEPNPMADHLPQDAVARLTPHGQPGSASIPADDNVPVKYDLTVADFVSYGAYGPLQIWSTTKLEGKRCIAVVGDNHISVFECTAPSVDTIADYILGPDMLPIPPSGELTEYVRFILHDGVVDVYRPTTGGRFYGGDCC